jgi:ATP-dependent DNA helicase DinG
MNFESRVADVFGEQGLIAQNDAHFKPREGQTQMAKAVARSIEQGSVLVVEAGTGVGKTYAYLVPALLSGERVVLSTATKALQDQLFGRDLPSIAKILNLPVRMALLKGRSSYLCLYRMELARSDTQLSDRGTHATLAKVEKWSQVTRNGDLAELTGLDERSPVIPLITSTRDNCIGAQCPKFKPCHVNLARKEAMAADVVVINHHLFFADLAVKDSGMAELLPTVSVVIFDEAHQLNETGVQFLGAQITTGQLLDLARDTLAAGLQLARGLQDWSALASGLERAARELRLSAGKQWQGAKLRWTALEPEGIDPQAWTTAILGVCHACEQLRLALLMVAELAPDFERLCTRTQELGQRAEKFLQVCPADAVRWVEVGQQLRLVESPLDIAESVRKKMLKISATDVPTEAPQAHKSWIFTSATLGHESQLKWFTVPCGLEQAEVLRVASPFDYANQASVYVPQYLPKPSDPMHSAEVASLVGQAVDVLAGRTLVLTTTLRALRAIGAALEEQFSERLDIEILIQGNLPKRELLARFREGASQGRSACVLVASASFWEGIDIPGDELALVVIDKLPFPPPDDPLIEARSKRLEQGGKSSFIDYFVPEATVSLKQGAGRLIRRETDMGMLVVCDTRLTQMGYGRKILAALPPMRQIQSHDEFMATLNSLIINSAL